MTASSSSLPLMWKNHFQIQTRTEAVNLGGANSSILKILVDVLTAE